MIDTPQPAHLVFEAVILRGVPCLEHRFDGCQNGCPDCLTGEQAEALGRDYDRVELGVIAESELSAADAASFLGIELRARKGLRRLLERVTA